MNKYKQSLNQMCFFCRTKPENCNKKKCNRYNNIKELVDETLRDKVDWKEKNINKYIKLFQMQEKGILQEFLDNQEEIKEYIESENKNDR